MVKKAIQLLAILMLFVAVAFPQTSPAPADSSAPQAAAPAPNATGDIKTGTAADSGTANPTAPQNISKDDALRGRIHDRLIADPALRNVTVSVNRGTAELRGAVATAAQSKHARELVAGVRGVKQVRNLIKIDSSLSANAAPQAISSGNSAGSIAGNTQAANSATMPPAPSAATSAGSNAGAKSSAVVAQNSLPQSDIETGNSAEGSNLKTQIETALRNEPTLSNEKITVEVTDTAVELQGNVPTSKDKQTAERIAQSYASNRRVTDHITVTGIAPASSNPATPPQAATTPGELEKNKAATPSADSTPKQATPQTQGDQSTDPR